LYFLISLYPLFALVSFTTYARVSLNHFPTYLTLCLKTLHQNYDKDVAELTVQRNNKYI